MENLLSSKKRVIVYIDGFNLYEGLVEQGWRKYLWLNLKKLSESLILKGQLLVCTKYFTTRLSHPPDKERRQGLFIDALTTLDNIRFFYGNFTSDSKICDRCRAIVHFKTEKQTDVNISTQMLVDAFTDKFDTAILITGDSDQVSTITQIRQFCADKSIVVAFPPKRESYELEKVATTAYRIVKAKFRDSQFPEEVTMPSGTILKRPIEWK